DRRVAAGGTVSTASRIGTRLARGAVGYSTHAPRVWGPARRALVLEQPERTGFQVFENQNQETLCPTAPSRSSYPTGVLASSPVTTETSTSSIATASTASSTSNP